MQHRSECPFTAEFKAENYSSDGHGRVFERHWQSYVHVSYGFAEVRYLLQRMLGFPGAWQSLWQSPDMTKKPERVFIDLLHKGPPSAVHIALGPRMLSVRIELGVGAGGRYPSLSGRRDCVLASIRRAA